uniref:PPM-type phosphatase domain-containing protein n=1 Tax=Arcella intermedia TaxID=1963864 RepID=A0A6B2LB93_9EUKA
MSADTGHTDQLPPSTNDSPTDSPSATQDPPQTSTPPPSTPEPSPPSPSTEQDPPAPKSLNIFRVGKDDTIGHRPTMEDQTVVYCSEDGEFHFFAIFDGHGGSSASVFCAEKLRSIIQSKLKGGSPPGPVESIIKESFQECNDALKETNSCSETGTTAVVAVVLGDQMWIANSGDSRAVLSKAEQAMRVTTDHKPTLEAERKRIEALKGFVFFGRVNGVLAVSRALGDFNFHPHVTCEPDVFGPFNVKDQENQFLILACDGLWDVVDDKHAVGIVQSCGSVQEGARKLVSTALDARSTDNISVAVVFFPNYAPNVH